MRKFLAIVVATATITASAALATSHPAEARWGGGWHGGGWHGGGWGWGGPALGLGLGLAAAGAFGPYYGYSPYGYAYPAYDCYLVRRWGPYGPHLVRVCS
jgi:hypothetical protein